MPTRTIISLFTLTTLLVSPIRLIAADGDKKKAEETYKKLLADDTTRFVGVRGLMNQKLAEGDTDKALKLAERAFDCDNFSFRLNLVGSTRKTYFGCVDSNGTRRPNHDGNRKRFSVPEVDGFAGLSRMVAVQLC